MLFYSINNIGTIENTNESRNRVRKAKEVYDALTDSQKAAIPSTSVKNLNDAVAVWEVIDKVNNIKSGYQEVYKDAIDDAKTSLNNLTADQKELMPQSVKDLLNDKEIAHGIMVEINDLYVVEYNDEYKLALDTANVDYQSLTDSQKALVNNYVVLSVNIQNYNRIDDAVQKIENIGKVRYSKFSKKAIEEARLAYNKVKEEQRPLVTNGGKLTEAEAKYEKAEHNHNVAMGWVKGLCIFFGVALLCACTFFIILIIVKKRKAKKNENKKKNGKKK